MFFLVALSFSFCTLKETPLSANAKFVFITNGDKEQKTYLQIEIHNNTDKNYYVYNPLFKILVKNGIGNDTLSITNLWGKEFLGETKPFIFEHQDSITLNFRKFMRESTHYKNGKLNKSVWSEKADPFILTHSPMVYFIKSKQSIKLKYFIGKIKNKGTYSIISNSPDSKDEINNYLPEKFREFDLYKNNIHVNEFSFVVE